MTVQELSELVRYHSDLYFNQGKPEISDVEFDILVDELRRVDPLNCALLEVGASTYGKTVKHPAIMGSLAKATDWTAIEKWAAQAPYGSLVLLTPKVDGIAVRLVYNNTKLVLAATRGNGTEGHDVTDNVRAIKSIPQTITICGLVEVRGEIYMKKSEWERQGEGANPRNCAVGALLQKDPTETGRKNLDFFAYDISFDDVYRTCESVKLSRITQASPDFGVVNWTEFEIGDKLRESLEMWEKTKRVTLDYQIDGMVLAFQSIEIQEELGWNGKCPRGKIAFKFAPEQKNSTITRVDWFVGRLGKITPVAVIAPTRLAGTTVTNVSLHNYANVRSLGIQEGDTVLVEKAGDIIPQLVRVIKHESTTNPIDVVPKECPSCMGSICLDSRNVNLWCENPRCSAKLVRSILHYLESLEVLGIGEGIAEKLCDSGMVKSLVDLYYLEKTALVGLLGGKRSAEKVYSAIMGKNEVPLAQFLDALGIDGLGTSTSNLFAKKYKTLDAVLSAEVSSMTTLEGVGVVTAQRIVKGLTAMTSVIEELRKVIDVQSMEENDGPLKGLSFCLTGTMSRTRCVIEKEIETAGGTIRSCGKGLTYLVQADPTSSSAKSEKAKKLGIKIIFENELNEMLSSKLTGNSTGKRC